MSVVLGVIADDYTGATDIAATLVKRGARAVQVLGVPDGPIDLGGADTVVVALKSRSVPADQAVARSLEALAWLRDRGARQIVFKYCSTFDSSPAGNIGPVADALAGALAAPIAFVCPAFPANRRTVYMGHLFVGDRLLAESPMKDHPLTPMTDSDLVRMMAAQSTGAVGLIALPVVRQGARAIAARARDLAGQGVRYAVVDALDDADLLAIGEAAADHPLVTGASGVASGLGPALGIGAPVPDGAPMPEVAGDALVLAGSCSPATRAQIAHVAGDWPGFALDIDDIVAGADVAGRAVAWARANRGSAPVVIHSSADPAAVSALQARHGMARTGALIEQAFARIAADLAEDGFRRIVIAGGETSGAVLGGLGVRALHICGEIDPGVPWTRSVGPEPLALALKSGNFGTADFFRKAFGALS